MSDFKTEYPVLYFNEYFKRKPMRLNERESEELFTLEETDVNNFEYISLHDHEKEIASLKEQLINKECNCCGGSDADVNKYISKLKKQLKREQECTDFYANKKNINQMCNGTGDDYEEIDGVFHGGKRARATQARREK